MGRKKIESNIKSAKVHPDLSGLDMHVNRFGEIKTNIDIDKINDFLNKNVDDKKLKKKDD
ncbi:MAG: hypothetical protein U0V72_05870 [Cytophagales bacterium]